MNDSGSGTPTHICKMRKQTNKQKFMYGIMIPTKNEKWKWKKSKKEDKAPAESTLK